MLFHGSRPFSYCLLGIVTDSSSSQAANAVLSTATALIQSNYVLSIFSYERQLKIRSCSLSQNLFWNYWSNLTNNMKPSGFHCILAVLATPLTL